MGTTWSAVVLGAPSLSAGALRGDIVRALDTIVAQMSAWVPHSDLSRFNRAKAGSGHVLPAEFYSVIDYALAVAAETGGAYDPTVGALTALWGFGPEGSPGAVPDESAIEAAKAKSGWRRLHLSRSGRRAVQPGGLVIDLCAVAKGFAVDCVADIVRAHGAADFLVEIGGELRGEGCKRDGSPWWVAVEAPRADATEFPDTVIALHGLAVATSSDQRRFFERDGRRYAHTIDPRTGYPVQNDVLSVTVIAGTCMEADALSTALYVLGEEEGLEFAKRHDIPALFVLAGNEGLRQHLSPALVAMTQ